MADVSAQREARRRKILDNAATRLRKISSLDTNLSEENPTTGANFSDLTIISQNTKATDLRKVEQRKGRRNLNLPATVSEREEVKTIYRNFEPDNESSDITYEFEINEKKVYNLRAWFIIILALLIRYLFLICERYGYISTTAEYNLNKIFVPLFAYLVFEHLFLKPPIRTNIYLNTIITLSNIQPQVAENVVKGLSIFWRIAEDVLVYFFTFACFDLIINTILQER